MNDQANDLTPRFRVKFFVQEGDNDERCWAVEHNATLAEATDLIEKWSDGRQAGEYVVIEQADER